MLKTARLFFEQHSVLEVDTDILSPSAPIDLHIDVMEVKTSNGIAFLHTSPEYAMKRLLCRGSGDIYQISHVFRDGESGPLHSAEFTMIEWYRLGFSIEEMIQETLSFARLFLGDLPADILTYREAFLRYADLDIESASLSHLAEHARRFHPASSPSDWDRDTLLQFLLGFAVEPHLGKNKLSVIQHFPKSQAALAQVRSSAEGSYAERFEIHFEGIELANGYHELSDPIEQRRRFVEANQQRMKRGKPSLPIDELFLSDLNLGLPDCCGVAVGFDRLLMLQANARVLNTILPLEAKQISLIPLLNDRVSPSHHE